MAPVVVRDAATVMLVRDTAAGLEVLLQQRSMLSDFVGGAHVFPGGAVDHDDRDVAYGRVCVGRTDAECSASLGLDHGGLAFWVAAVRETFEEAGLLLARRPGDEHLVSLLEPSTVARFAAHRAAVSAGRPLADVLVEEGLVLDVDRLHPVSRWITPEGPQRRYDTRFFVAAAPPDQVPLHDDRETIASTWLGPAEALACHHRGELQLVLPTICNLELLASFATVDQALAAAQAMREVPVVRPRLVGNGVGMRILLPGEAGYDEAGRG